MARRGWQVPKECSWLQPWLLCLTQPASLLPAPPFTTCTDCVSAQPHCPGLSSDYASMVNLPTVPLFLPFWPTALFSTVVTLPSFRNPDEPLTSLLRTLSFPSCLDQAPELSTASTQSGCHHLVVSAPAMDPSLCISQVHTRASSPAPGRRENHSSKPQRVPGLVCPWVLL